LGFYDLARVFKVSGYCGTVLTQLLSDAQCLQTTLHFHFMLLTNYVHVLVGNKGPTMWKTTCHARQADQPVVQSARSLSCVLHRHRVYDNDRWTVMFLQHFKHGNNSYIMPEIVYQLLVQWCV